MPAVVARRRLPASECWSPPCGRSSGTNQVRQQSRGGQLVDGTVDGGLLSHSGCGACDVQRAAEVSDASSAGTDVLEAAVEASLVFIVLWKK
jgi:hypothetical protein